jgi:lipopolysaccharide exporter
MDEEVDASQVAETFARTDRLAEAVPGVSVDAEHRLTRSVARGMGWTWSGVAGILAMQLVYTAVMARTIDPKAFGLVASALVGLRFVAYLSNFSLGSAVVQRPNLDDDDIVTALVLSVLIGILVAGAAVMLSSVLAAVVQVPESAAVMRWLAPGLFLGSIAVVLEALLRRALRFGAITLTQLTSFAVGYLFVGIPLAQRGWGVWSLVAASVVQSAGVLIGYLLTVRPRFRGHISVPAARSLLRFAGTVSATGFLEFLTGSLDTLAVGRWVGAAGLGQYSRGTYLVALPVEHATKATTRVLLPALSQVQGQRDRFAHAFLHGAGITAAVIMVPVALAASAAPALVDLVLGPGWSNAALVLPIVGTAYGIGLLTYIPGMAAEAQGTITVKLGIQIATLVALVGAIGVTAAVDPSLTGFAWCWLGTEVLRFILYWILVVPRLGVTRTELGRQFAGAAALALAATVPVLVVVRLADATGFIALGLSTLVGLTLAAAALATPFGRLIRDDLAAIRTRLQA